MKTSDTKFGKCPWCERHDQVLYFCTGIHDGQIWVDYICGRCLDETRKIDMKRMLVRGEHCEPAE